jgi:hypothetical protein
MEGGRGDAVTRRRAGEDLRQTWFILPGGNFGLARRETSAAGTLAVPKERYAVRWEGSYKP